MNIQTDSILIGTCSSLSLLPKKIHLWNIGRSQFDDQNSRILEKSGRLGDLEYKNVTFCL